MHEGIELGGGGVSDVEVGQKKVTRKKVAKKNLMKKKMSESAVVRKKVSKKKVQRKKAVEKVLEKTVVDEVDAVGELIEFVVLSGAHRGKVVRYTVGQKSLYIGKSGLLVSLSLLGVVETGKREDGVVFRFVYGASESSALLPRRAFALLKAAVNRAVAFAPSQGHSSGLRGSGPVVVSGRGGLSGAARVGSKALGALKQGARRVAGSTGCKTCGR